MDEKQKNKGIKYEKITFYLYLVLLVFHTTPFLSLQEFFLNFYQRLPLYITYFVA